MTDPAVRPGRLRPAGRAGLRADRTGSSITSSRRRGFEDLRRTSRHHGVRLGHADRRHCSPACSGLGLSYAAVRRAEPGPGAARDAARAALPGVARQVLRRRALRRDRRRPDALPRGRSAEFLDEYLVDGLVRLAAWVPRLSGPRGPRAVPERPDPVLRGRDRPGRGRPALAPALQLIEPDRRPTVDRSVPRMRNPRWRPCW